MLLKVVLFAYSRGIVSSREIERACREQVIFIALSGDSAPHFTTFADFVSTLGDVIRALFMEVLLICDRQGLIGREMFAIDGVKLPSNASKARSGPRANFQDCPRHRPRRVAWWSTRPASGRFPDCQLFWVRTIVESMNRCSMSASPCRVMAIRSQTPFSRRRAKRTYVRCQWPSSGG